MLSIAHAVTGAFIAANLPCPWIFAPLAFFSHFVLDHVYHYDAGVAMRDGHWRLFTTAIVAGLDLCLAAILVAIFWRQSPTHFTWQIWLGAFFAILPDLIESFELFFSHPLKIFQPLSRLHHRVHRSTSNIFFGLLPQVILVAFIGIISLLNW